MKLAAKLALNVHLTQVVKSNLRYLEFRIRSAGGDPVMWTNSKVKRQGVLMKSNQPNKDNFRPEENLEFIA
jgi:hypothetical protein